MSHRLQDETFPADFSKQRAMFKVDASVLFSSTAYLLVETGIPAKSSHIQRFYSVKIPVFGDIHYT